LAPLFQSLSRAVRDRVPEAWRPAFRAVKHEARVIARVRPGQQCPICGNRFRFIVVNSAGGRSETLCLSCESLERHRRQVLLLRRATNLYEGGLSVLHIAPERSLRRELESIPDLDYVTGDLYAEGVTVKVDVTDIAFAAGTFDVVLCSHVLEHVTEDVKAMRELARVLKADGWALINVPSDPQRLDIYEDASVVAEADRLRLFGQRDHVRVYSQRGFVDRLRSAGFVVDVDPVTFSGEERRRHLLDGDIGWDHAYLCRPQ
jgi:SAM-dependent methyltransferase